MNGAKITAEKFRVKWDDEKFGESGWLSEFELVPADHKKALFQEYGRGKYNVIYVPEKLK